MSLKSTYIYRSNELFVAFLAFPRSPIHIYTHIIMEHKRKNSTFCSLLLVIENVFAFMLYKSVVSEEWQS